MQVDERGCDGDADVSLEETFISSSNDDSHSRAEKVSLACMHKRGSLRLNAALAHVPP